MLEPKEDEYEYDEEYDEEDEKKEHKTYEHHTPPELKNQNRKPRF